MGQASSRRKTLPSLADEPSADKLRANCQRFRILIIGRANSGKTTILQRVCRSSGKPVVFNPQGLKLDSTVLSPSAFRGIHDIKNEMVFESNPYFCFHDSGGFEAGGIDELEKIKAFLDFRTRERRLLRQIHAIWYCIPVDDSRPFTAAEREFFSKCGTGKVPVIAVFTKFDALDDKTFGALVAKGVSMQEAIRLAPKQATKAFESTHCKNLYAQPYPPRDHVYLRDMNQNRANCGQLMEKTAAALDNEVLQRLFVLAQRNSLELCMRYAIDRFTKEMMKLSEEEQKNLGLADFKTGICGILSWFPQHNGYDDFDDVDFDKWYTDVNNLIDNRRYHPESDTIYNTFSPLLEGCEPILILLYFPIITIILADFEYVLWDAGHEKAFPTALSVYLEKGPDHATIMEPTKEALKSFKAGAEYEDLCFEIFQIALNNRLPHELLEDSIVTGKKDN